MGRRVGERLSDLSFWRSELQSELEKMINESNMLQDSRRTLEKSIQDLEAPLHIAQECLYQRENRTGNGTNKKESINLLYKDDGNMRKLYKKITF